MGVKGRGGGTSERYDFIHISFFLSYSKIVKFEFYICWRHCFDLLIVEYSNCTRMLLYTVGPGLLLEYLSISLMLSCDQQSVKSYNKFCNQSQDVNVCDKYRTSIKYMFNYIICFWLLWKERSYLTNIWPCHHIPPIQHLTKFFLQIKKKKKKKREKQSNYDNFISDRKLHNCLWLLLCEIFRGKMDNR